MTTKLTLITATAVLALAATGCSAASTTTSSNNTGVSKKADSALAAMQGKVLSKGPHGETAQPASAADLSSGEIAKVKAKGATAAIVMHYGGNDWANAQVAGLKSEFGKLGINIATRVMSMAEAYA